MSHADLCDSHLNEANLINANLEGVILESCKPDGFAIVNLANFEGANLSRLFGLSF